MSKKLADRCSFYSSPDHILLSIFTSTLVTAVDRHDAVLPPATRFPYAQYYIQYVQKPVKRIQSLFIYRLIDWLYKKPISILSGTDGAMYLIIIKYI